MNILGKEIARNELLKWFAIAIVAFFILETFAIYSQYSSSGGTGSAGATSLDNFVGTATGNATVISYDPGIIVSGGASADAAIEALKNDGMVAFSSKGPDGTVVSLSSRSYMQQAVSRLLAANATVSGYASVAVNNIRVEGTGISRNVSSKTMRIALQPVYDPGDVLQVSFPAQVENGEMTGWGQVQVAPQQPVSVVVSLENVTVKGEYYQGTVPWEQRTVINASDLGAKLGSGYNVSFRRINTIGFDPLPNSTQSSNLSSNLPAYVTGYQAGRISVAAQFNDSAKIKSDMAAFGLNPAFSPSVLEIRQTGSGSVEGVQADVFAAIGLNLTFSKTFEIGAILPATVIGNGENYTLTQRNLTLASPVEPTGSEMAVIQFTPIGRLAGAIERAQLLPSVALPQGNTDESFIGINDTAYVNNLTSGNLTAENATAIANTSGNVAAGNATADINASGNIGAASELPIAANNSSAIANTSVELPPSANNST
jgi:hypothetical protein